MRTRDFYFNLPPHLIAQKPAEKRNMSRLMVLNRKDQSILHTTMDDFPNFLPDSSLLVVNNSRVRKARIYARLETGTELELLFMEDLEDEHRKKRNLWAVMTNKTRRLKPGRIIELPGLRQATVTDISGEGSQRVLSVNPPLDEEFFQQYGHVPLPPYIHREDLLEDSERYQTVYADPLKTGSVAAPTAGLHFTPEILSSIADRGSTVVPVTLHVGAGTFLPVRSEFITEHTMHYEHYEIGEQQAEMINRASNGGRAVVAVGTTSIRTLESAADETGTVSIGENRTNLFISPGYRFKTVKHLLTNFHTPESSLLMLVSAFAGYDFIMRAYEEAVREEYRFFSYGDAMFII